MRPFLSGIVSLQEHLRPNRLRRIFYPMYRLFLFLLALCPAARPATAQDFGLADDSVRPCGFHSPNVAAARRFLTSNFDTLRFAPGERIADIGAQSGNFAGILSLFYDDLDITLEDIDSTCLNPAQLRNTMRYYYRMRERSWPKHFRTHLVLGSESSTELPSATYGTVFFMNAYHEVAEKGPMLAELYRILAPGGSLYVSEKSSTTKHLRRRDCGHGMPLEKEMLRDFNAAGFRLTHTKVADHYRRKGDRVQHSMYLFSKEGTAVGRR